MCVVKNHHSPLPQFIAKQSLKAMIVGASATDRSASKAYEVTITGHEGPREAIKRGAQEQPITSPLVAHMGNSERVFILTAEI